MFFWFFHFFISSPILPPFTCRPYRECRLESDAFFEVLRRFSSNRGCIKGIWGDNSTNFSVAEKKIRKLLRDWIKDVLTRILIAFALIHLFTIMFTLYVNYSFLSLLRVSRPCDSMCFNFWSCLNLFRALVFCFLHFFKHSTWIYFFDIFSLSCRIFVRINYSMWWK